MLLLLTFHMSQILTDMLAHCLDVVWDIHTFCPSDYHNFGQKKIVTFFLTHRSDLKGAHWAMSVTSKAVGPSLFIRKATMEMFQGRGTS